MTEFPHVRLRWTLPCAQLLECLFLLWPFRYGYAFQVRNTLHAYFPALVNGQALYLSTSGPARENDKPALYNLELRLAAPAVLNTPVGFVGLGRRETIPGAFMSDWWRALSWPLYGIVFWWMAGRGIEALSAIRHSAIAPALTWVETIVAALIAVGTAALLIGLVVDPDVRSDLIFPWRLAVGGCSLWLILALMTILASLLQWRLRRRMPTEPNAALLA